MLENNRVGKFWDCIAHANTGGGTITNATVDWRNPPSRSIDVDASKVLPGINDGYAGSAPDIGAYEYGAPLPGPFDASCSEDLGSGTTALIPALPSQRMFLVGARNAAGEGPFGTTSAGVERAPAWGLGPGPLPVARGDPAARHLAAIMAAWSFSPRGPFRPGARAPAF